MPAIALHKLSNLGAILDKLTHKSLSAKFGSVRGLHFSEGW